MQIYEKEFYRNRYKLTYPAAREIIPIILELMPVNSVVDLGCGVGVWLNAFKEYGVDTILGLDGKWVNKLYLCIPDNCFIEHNLTEPVQLNRSFDLAISLEVAEHLPEKYAKIFVASLTSLAPSVLFSAAVPFQGGINHINEQWPDYWASLFKSKGYVTTDPVRRKIWQNEKVLPHYAQNILFFVKQELLENNLLKKEYELTSNPCSSIVHPKIYLNAVYNMQLKNMPFKKALVHVLKILPMIAFNALSRRIKNIF